MSRVILNGEAGETWTNDGAKVLYQLIVKFQNSCGVCIQFANAIGAFWPIPFHRNCRCVARAIWPGQQAAPYVDYLEEIRKLDPKQQAVAVGASNWRLLEAGKVKWDDVVTKTRVRTLQEVVSKNKLGVDQLVKAGVKPWIAEAAYKSVNTPAHVLANEARKELIDKLQQVGLSHKEIKEGFGERMAKRVIVGPGPTPPPPKPKPPNPTPLLPGILTDVLKVKPASAKAATKPVASVQPILPGRPITERLAAYAAGEAKLDAITAIGDEISGLQSELTAAQRRLEEYRATLTDNDWRDSNKAALPKRQKVASLVDELGGLRGKLERAKDSASERLFKALEVPTAERTDWIATGRENLRPIASDGVIDRAENVLAQLRRMVRGGKIEFEWRGVGSHEDPREYHLGHTTAGRRHSTVHLLAASPKEIIAHELGHAIEWEIPGVHKSVKEFKAHRIGSEQPKQLKALFPDANFRDDEFGAKDHFDRYFGERSAYYTGKVITHENSEVITMGLQALWQDPIAFVAKDREFAKFLLGILDGSLR